MKRWPFAILILGIYAISFFLPVVRMDGFGDDPKSSWFLGYDAFLIGWAWPGVIPDLANVAMVVGLIAYLGRSPKLARNSAVLAVILASTAPFVYGFALPLFIGYYVWLGSFLALAIASELELRSREATRTFTPTAALT
jgi:hypothetical protein